MATAKEIQELFLIQGISVAAWARERGFPPGLVYRVLRGEANCRRGTTYRIGIALGLTPAPSARQQQLLTTLPTFKPAEGNDKCSSLKASQ